MSRRKRSAHRLPRRRSRRRYPAQSAAAVATSVLALTVAPAAEIARLIAGTRQTIGNARSENTRLAYEGDLRRFAAWCTAMNFASMPASAATIALYMQAQADRGSRYSTIERSLAAICSVHARAGHGSPWKHPLVADVREGLRKKLGIRPTKKRAIDDEFLRRVLAVVPTGGLLGLRDRALLLLGWSAALRRSELVALDVADVTRVAKGLIVLVRWSKTDQVGLGEEVPVFFSNLSEHCPVRALDGWLKESEIVDGAIFRRLGRHGDLGDRLSPPAVLHRVQHYVEIAERGRPESERQPYRDFGAHSLRSGFITTAARRGKDLDSIMKTSRHKSERVARGYIQRETIFERAAGEGLL